MMEKRWVLKEQGDKEVVERLAEELKIDNNLANLLAQRGVTSYEAAKDFFRPNLSHLHDPFLMKDMDLAVERIDAAVRNNEKILIYGDYDVDGTTAVALVYTYFRDFHHNIDFYIPDRYTEGYGISYQGIDFAYQHNFSLVIALDCGIKAVEKIAYAKEKQIDFIICDHHRPGDELPQAVAVLDPKRDDCDYPYKELSGCGVGFKLIQAAQHFLDIPNIDINDFLDLVVVSIASDIVPVTGENRILAYYGLKLINSKPRPGIEAILKYCNVKRIRHEGENIFSRVLTVNDLVFLVGPRINAAGRIESARNSVELLIARDPNYALRVGEQINTLNTTRKNLDTQTTSEALEKIRTDEELKAAKTTIVYDPEWHKGVIGIVASRLTEEFYRPTIVFTKSNGLITGSARSVKDYDIYDAVDACSEYLEHFGGHKYAAGLSMKPENFEKFSQCFTEYVNKTITDDMLIPQVSIDAEINLNVINDKFYRILKQFAPFGPGNHAPVFKTKRVIDTGYGKIVGSNHIKFTVIHPGFGNVNFPAIAFQMGEKMDVITRGFPFEISYQLEENEWNGKVNLQLNIKDIKA